MLPSSLTRNAASAFAGMAGPIVIIVAVTPFYLNRLGAPAFGVVALVWTAVTMLSEFGAGRASTHFVASALASARAQQAAAALRAALKLQVVLGTVLGVLLFLSAPFLANALDVGHTLRSETRVALVLIALAAPVLLLNAVLRGTLEALRRFERIAAVNFSVTCLAYLVPIPLVQAGGGLVTVVGVALAARLAGVVTMGWLVHELLPLRGRQEEVQEAAHLLRFAGWSSLSALAAPVLLYLDRIVLAALVSVTALAYYAPAYEAATRLLLIPMSVASALFPAISSSASSAETTSQSGQAQGLIMSVLLLPIVLLAGLAPDLLTGWLGSSAGQQAAPAVRVLGVGILMNALAFVPYALLQGRGRADLPALLHLVELPVHVLLVFVLVRRFGLPGAALAWTLRVFIDCLALWWMVWRLRLLERPARLFARLGAAAASALSLVLAAAWLGGQQDVQVRWLGTAAALAAGALLLPRWWPRAGAPPAFFAVDPARS